MSKAKKWPIFEVDEPSTVEKLNEQAAPRCNSLGNTEKLEKVSEVTTKVKNNKNLSCTSNSSDWMKNFDPATVEELAVHNKKIQDVEQWICSTCESNRSDMLLLSGPVGCGKTATIQTVSKKHNVKITEWITPLDIEFPSEYGDYEYKEKQSTIFLDFIIKAANFISLLDNNSKKLVVVEDMPHTFIRTPSEFSTVLQQYRNRAKSPIVFICSDSHMDSKNTAFNLFTPAVKEQFNIQHITFNSISPTGLRGALKRVAEIINNKFTSLYTTPTSELIECVLNSSGGDVRSAVLNLHFACLKGAKHDLDTSIVEKEQKTKGNKKRKMSKFVSIGKDETVSILHGVGRVLNPKVTENGNKLSHPPADVIEQFLGQPGSFVNFLEENYLPHFASIEDAEKAATALSTSDYMMSEWRERFCQEYGLYIAVAGLMLANKHPVSAWNPVRGPKNMRVQYPSLSDLPQIESNELYNGRVLVSDYQTYCKIIGNAK